MKYFISAEYLDGRQSRRFLGFRLDNISEKFRTKHLLEVVTIAIVRENAEGYFGISKDFNLDEAWNRVSKKQKLDHESLKLHSVKCYHFRETVLRQLFKKLIIMDNGSVVTSYISLKDVYIVNGNTYIFNKDVLKELLSKYGKTTSELADEVWSFLGNNYSTIYHNDCKVITAYSSLFNDGVEPETQAYDVKSFLHLVEFDAKCKHYVNVLKERPFKGRVSEREVVDICNRTKYVPISYNPMFPKRISDNEEDGCSETEARYVKKLYNWIVSNSTILDASYKVSLHRRKLAKASGRTD